MPDALPPRASAMVSPTLAGELNRARVLKTLYARGPLPRPELARATGTTRATIGQIVQPLLDQGVLAEGEPLASSALGGKRPRPLWFADDGWRVGAVVLLPGGADVALVSAGGLVVARTTVSFGRARPDHDAVVDLLADAVREVAGDGLATLRGVGVAVGGLVDTRTGEVVRVQLVPQFDGLAIGPALAASLGVPAHVDNHARALALGDLLFGLGRGHDSFCSLYVGEGIGAGFILDGTLHRGRRGAGGEVGHVVVDTSGAPCNCGRTGCWETLAANRWLRGEAAALNWRGAKQITVARLVTKALTDPAAVDLLDRWTGHLALGVANLQQTFGVGRFIVHGEPVRGGEALREDLQARVRQAVFDHPGGEVTVSFAEADDVTAVRGAAAVALSRTLHVAF